MAKRIKTAWIQQVIEFDSEEDYMKWYNEISASKTKHRIQNTEQNGKTITVTVVKQYNKNYFPFEERKVKQ